MKAWFSADRIRFLINRIQERLWVRPLITCLFSIGVVFLSKLADNTALGRYAPELAPESLDALLTIMASSMLVIATFSVGSMVSAYASASNTVTPRSFAVVVADDASQNALSTFVGAFIFSIVALTALNNDYFLSAGLFVLYLWTVIVFGSVVITFVRWVDRIARLGRMGSTIEKVENAAMKALRRRRNAPTLNAMPVGSSKAKGHAVFASDVGYVEQIDIEALQQWAEDVKARIVVNALPGTFASPDVALAFVFPEGKNKQDEDYDCVVKPFKIGRDRIFDDDPRFGLVVLSEIAARALSPAVNDHGTAIDIIGTIVRLFTKWQEPADNNEQPTKKCTRVEVPEVETSDMFEDAFTAIARDGAGVVEVSVRLQKALHSLAQIGDEKMREAALQQSRLALKRAKHALSLPEDFQAVEAAGEFAQTAKS